MSEETIQSTNPQATYFGVLDMQICVPQDWTDEEAEFYANQINPSGLDHGWKIRREGDKRLGGSPERCPCAQREGMIHIMLDC